MSNYDEQIPYSPAFVDTKLADNPEPRCPCILLLDTSGSMNGEPIRQLNDALVLFKDELMADSMSIKRVEIAIITFGPVRVVSDFLTPDEFQPTTLTASGDTPMGSAIREGIELLRNRKEHLRRNGIDLFRPWIFLITDGGPTDAWSDIPNIISEGEAKNSFSFFAIAVDNANMDTLRQMAQREPITLKGHNFRPLFRWLSDSLKRVSSSNPGDKVSLPDYRPYGWAEV